MTSLNDYLAFFGLIDRTHPANGEDIRARQLLLLSGGTTGLFGLTSLTSGGYVICSILKQGNPVNNMT
jgi:hypothetical protein